MTLAVFVFAFFAQGQTTARADHVLKDLSGERGAFPTYDSTGKRPTILDDLGVNDLGNPWREEYFPTGSAAYQLWLVNWYGDTGSLVKQTPHGKRVKIAWELRLRYAPKKERPEPKGTFARILWHLGYEPIGKLTKDESSILNAVQGYAGYMYGRGPVDDDMYAWYVYPDGRLRAYYAAYQSTPVIEGNSVHQDLDLYKHPAITPEEAKSLGFETFNGWHPSCVASINYGKQTWLDRPYGTVPGRGDDGE